MAALYEAALVVWAFAPWTSALLNAEGALIHRFVPAECFGAACDSESPRCHSDSRSKLAGLGAYLHGATS